MQHLDQPKEAFLSYRKVLQSEFKLTDIQKKRIIEKADDAKQMAKERSNAVSLDIGNGQPQRNKVPYAADVENLKPAASIPLQERIRLIQPTKKPPRYPLGSIAPCEKCGQARWVDGRKIPPEGARLKCLSCAHSFDLNGE